METLLHRSVVRVVFPQILKVFRGSVEDHLSNIVFSRKMYSYRGIVEFVNGARSTVANGYPQSGPGSGEGLKDKKKKPKILVYRPQKSGEY